MPLSLTTAPASYLVVTMAEVKKQLRMEETTADDTFITSILIPAAYDRAEFATQRQLFTATWALKLDHLSDDLASDGYIELPRPPLRTVTGVSYVDQNGTATTWASTNYTVDAPAGPRCRRGRVALGYGISWPTAREQINAITVTFTAGYGTLTTDLPPLLRAAILLDIGTLFENREDVIKGTFVQELPTSTKSIYQAFRSHGTQAGVAA